MSKKLQAMLARIGEDDPRYEIVKQGTHIIECSDFGESGNGKPMCKAYFENGVIATVLGSANPSSDDWFKQLADELSGTDQTARLAIEIENLSHPDVFGGYGVIAGPVRAESDTNTLNVIVDELDEYLNKPENAGKCDQRPRGQKDEDLMTILRIAAKRNGYVDDTSSQSYSKFTNDVLWAAVEEGLPFRVRHAIMDSKSGDAHYNSDS